MLKKVALSVVCIVLILGFMVMPVMAKEGVKIFKGTGSTAYEQINKAVETWVEQNPGIQIVGIDTEMLINSPNGLMTVLLTVQYRI